ncbi:MAG: hypothetical protein L0J79_05820 [Propionibacterium sp.]|nr:hypothetical protein [Propionibacterium sp.]
MADWGDLVRWDPRPLRDAAAQLTSLAGAVDEISQDLRASRPSQDEWRGEAASAAGTRLMDLARSLGDLTVQLRDLAVRTHSAADLVGDVQRLTDDARAFADSRGLVIAGDGAVSHGAGSALMDAATAAQVSLDIGACADLVRKAFDRASDLVETVSSNSWLQGLRTFIVEVGRTVLQDGVAERIAAGLSDALTKLSPVAVLKGALVGGGTLDVNVPVNPGAVRAAGQVASKGALVIGAALDFGEQLRAVDAGEQNVGDAVIRTAAHTGIGVGSAMAAGAIIGSAFPGLGTVVGGLAGAVVGAAFSVAGSAVFDKVYDSVGGWRGIGDAVIGLFR